MTSSASEQFLTVRNALQAASTVLINTSSSARLDAELLLAVALGKDRSWQYAHPDEPLTEKQAQVFRALLAQRAEGRPIAHLTGRREFWSLELAVNEHTLVPRPETETLVEAALNRIPADSCSRILDLGTGSGAIAIAIACERPHCTIIATDRSAGALDVAAENAQRHCPDRITFLQGDWYGALPADTEAFDVIIANPPYIGEQETSLTDPELAFEPVDALFSGKDGLHAIRQIVAGASLHLRRGGWLLFEHGFAQAPDAAGLLAAAGYQSVDNVHDLSGHPRVSYGQFRT